MQHYWVRVPLHVGGSVATLVAEQDQGAIGVHCHAVALVRYGLAQTFASLVVAPARHQHSCGAVGERYPQFALALIPRQERCLAPAHFKRRHGSFQRHKVIVAANEINGVERLARQRSGVDGDAAQQSRLAVGASYGLRQGIDAVIAEDIDGIFAERIA